VKLEHNVVELGTELIKLMGSADVTVVLVTEETSEALALTRGCLLMGILIIKDKVYGKKVLHYSPMVPLICPEITRNWRFRGSYQGDPEMKVLDTALKRPTVNDYLMCPKRDNESRKKIVR
jgi:hypothetical protein